MARVATGRDRGVSLPPRRHPDLGAKRVSALTHHAVNDHARSGEEPRRVGRSAHREVHVALQVAEQVAHLSSNGATTTCNVPLGWNGHVSLITARAVNAARNAPTITPPTDSHIVRHWYLDPRVRHSSRRNSVACGQRSFGSNSMARR